MSEEDDNGMGLFGDDSPVITKEPTLPEKIDDEIEEDEEIVGKDYVLKVKNTDKLVLHLEKYFNNKELSDIKFEFEGDNTKSLCGHKFLLAARSTKFDDMFKDGKTTITVPKKFTFDTFSQCIKFLYTGKASVDKVSVEAILGCSDFYGIESLKSICFEFNLKGLDNEAVCKILMKAKKKEFEYDATRLVDKCLVFLEEQASDVVDSKAFLDFDEELVVKVCQNGKLCIGETDLLNGVVRWGKEQVKKNKDKTLNEILKNVIPHLRLPQLGEDDIKDIATPLDLWTKDEIAEALDYCNNPDDYTSKDDARFKARSVVFAGSSLIKSKEAVMLEKWIKSKNKKPWKLIYKASKDGFAASQFHKMCDNKGETISIIKAQNGNIFGGYTPKAWNTTGSYEYDATAFVFSFVNAQKKPMKFDQNTIYGQYSQLGNSSYGPTFGGGHDFMICNNSNTTNSSYSNFGYSYTITSTGYAYGQTQAQSFLAGSYNFKTLEVEVFARK